MKVHGKTLIVTGGGSGIGRQVTLELLRRGARVAAVDLRPEALEGTVAAAGAGDRLATLPLDITDRAAVAGLPALVEQALGPIDGVLNVAGIIQPFVPLAELDVAVMERVFDVNVWGTINVLQATLPHLLARPEAHVVDVSSMGGFLPVPGQSVYGASKAAVKLLTEALWAELQGTKVGVTVVMPGAVGTDIATNSGVSIPGMDADGGSSVPMTSPESAARQIVDGIESNRLHVHVGKDSLLMGLLVRAAPKQAIRFIQRQMRDLLAAAAAGS